jgi:hypothetical protein
VKRATEIGRQWREDVGQALPGPGGREFLERVDEGVRLAERRARRWRLLAGSALVPVLLVMVVMASEIWRGNGAGRESRDGRPVAEVPHRQPRDDPAAASLLESARLRLDGFGDPKQALPRLEDVVERYPGTRSAARAEALLERLRGE